MTRRSWLLLAAVWLVSGVYVVRAGQAGVVRRFGRVAAGNVPPGIHYHLPYPVERVDRVRIQEQQRVSVGFEAPDEVLGAQRDQGQYLTGDQNLINVPVMVQYTVSDPVAYLFTTRDVPRILRAATEAALAKVVSGQGVDFVLTIGRSEVQAQVQDAAQAILDGYGIGVSLSSVNLQDVQPPAEVRDAFAEVASAREDRSRIVDEARGYANEVLPRARGEAEKLLADAQGYREKRINEARGDADRFLKAYQQYRLAKDVTSARLYLEAMEEILPKLKTVVVDSHGAADGVDLSLIERLSREGEGEKGGTGEGENGSGSR